MNASFLIGFSRRVMGWGRPYLTQISLISWNQDLAEGLASIRISIASEFRMFPSRWQIIPNIESWRR